jgi:DNA-binding transcriptional LysR family regulator
MKMIEPLDSPDTERHFLDMAGMLKSGETVALTSRAPRISLKQWKMFHAVIDSGGFFGAADSLHVTQSTISHAIAKIQEQLGIALLELKGRKAQITDEGKILLEKSRELVRHANEIEALADNLRQGWGREIRVALDPGFPSDLLIQALRHCSPFLHKMRLSVREVAHDGAWRALHANEADLAISTQPISGFVASKLIDIEHVAVAHPTHPLFSLKRDISLDDLKMQCEIAIFSLHHYGDADTHKHLARYQGAWHVSSLDRAVGMLRQGIGYAWLPRHQVQGWLDAGHLRILPVTGACHYTTCLYLIRGRTLAAGSAAERFADALHACSERFPPAATANG